MKKRSLLALAFVIILSFSFTACSSSSKTFVAETAEWKEVSYAGLNYSILPDWTEHSSDPEDEHYGIQGYWIESISTSVSIGYATREMYSIEEEMEENRNRYVVTDGSYGWSQMNIITDEKVNTKNISGHELIVLLNGKDEKGEFTRTDYYLYFPLNGKYYEIWIHSDNQEIFDPIYEQFKERLGA